MRVTKRIVRSHTVIGLGLMIAYRVERGGSEFLDLTFRLGPWTLYVLVDLGGPWIHNIEGASYV